MKKIFAILLTFLIAWPLMLKVYVFSTWQINRDYIAATSCENRNDISSDCEGTCQLIKQLKTAEPTDKPYTPPVGVEKIELSTFTVVNILNVLVKESSRKSDYHISNNNLLQPDIAFSFFHPPEFVI